MLEPVFSQTSSGEDTFDRLQGHIGFLPMDLVHPRNRFIVEFRLRLCYISMLFVIKRGVSCCCGIFGLNFRYVCLMCGAAISRSIVLPCDHIVLFKSFPFHSLCVSLSGLRFFGKHSLYANSRHVDTFVHLFGGGGNGGSCLIRPTRNSEVRSVKGRVIPDECSRLDNHLE